MRKYNLLTIHTATIVALLLNSPALARCARPNGRFVGGGAGPVYSKGGAPLGNQSETWDAFIAKTEPAAGPKGQGKLASSVDIDVRTPPQPGVPTSVFGYYHLSMQYPDGSVSWDEDACRGALSFRLTNDVYITPTWVDQKGDKTGGSSLNDTPLHLPKIRYNLTAAAGGSVLIATLDPTNLAERFLPRDDAFPAYVPAYSIRLEKQ
jgi:hypothetical protein